MVAPRAAGEHRAGNHIATHLAAKLLTRLGGVFRVYTRALTAIAPQWGVVAASRNQHRGPYNRLEGPCIPSQVHSYLKEISGAFQGLLEAS